MLVVAHHRQEHLDKGEMVVDVIIPAVAAAAAGMAAAAAKEHLILHGQSVVVAVAQAT
jgi:hypothetical protein